MQERYRTGAPGGRGLYCGSDFVALFEKAPVAQRMAELHNAAYGSNDDAGYNPREVRLAKAAQKASEDAAESERRLQALRSSADRLYKDNHELSAAKENLTGALRKADRVIREQTAARDGLASIVRRLESDLEELGKVNEELRKDLVRSQRRSGPARKLDEKGNRIDV